MLVPHGFGRGIRATDRSRLLSRRAPCGVQAALPEDRLSTIVRLGARCARLVPFLWLATLAAAAATGLFPSSAAGLSASAPANDNVANAEAVLGTSPDTASGTIVDATSEAGFEGLWGSDEGVWFKFTPTEDARLRWQITKTGGDSGFTPEANLFRVLNDPPADLDDLEWVDYLGNGSGSPPKDDVIVNGGDEYYIMVVNYDYGEGAQGQFDLYLRLIGSRLYERWEGAQIDDEVWAVHTQGTNGNQNPNTGPWAVSAASSFDGAKSVRHEPNGTHKVLLYRDLPGGGQNEVEYWIAYRFLVPSWEAVWANGSRQLYLPAFLLGDGTSSPDATGDYLGNLLEVFEDDPTRGGIWLNNPAPNPLGDYEFVSELSEGVWHEFRVSVRRSNGTWYINEILDGVVVSSNFDYGSPSGPPIGIWWVSRSWNTGGVLYVDPLIWSPGEDPGPIDSALPQCGDVIDNDGDGLIDLFDPGCSNAQDDSEAPDPQARCANGVDDDGDGKIDLADPGCTNAQDDSESPDPPTQCANGADDDGDSKIDLADPGCADAQDDSEAPDPSLLEQYARELRFATNEPYRPSSAALATDTYVTEAPAHANHLKRPNLVPLLGPEVIASANPHELINGEPLADLSLSYLASDDLEGDFIDEPEWLPSGQAQSAEFDYVTMLSRYPGKYEGKMYGRVVSDSDSGDRILQYRFYYYYNQKTFYRGGEHEGDWEWIQLRLNSSGIPVAATYSQHGPGEKCNWVDVDRVNGTHPIVWPAVGSHANYFRPGQYPVPIPGLPDGTDETAPLDAYVALTPSAFDQTQPEGWIEWHGYWGASQGTVGGAGRSPRSPGWQSAWSAFSWEEDPTQTLPCRAAMPLRLRAQARTDSAPQGTATWHGGNTARPTLPRIAARLSRDRTRVIVNYCFASMPSNRHLRPWRLSVGVDNLRDKLPALVFDWRIRRRCEVIQQTVGPIKPRYTLLIQVIAFAGDRSKLLRIRL